MQYCKFNPYEQCFKDCENCSRNDGDNCELCGGELDYSNYITFYGKPICNECLYEHVEFDELLDFAKKNSDEFLDFLREESKAFQEKNFHRKKEL